MIVSESFACAVTCTGETTLAFGAGEQIVTEGIAAALTSHTGGIGTFTSSVAFVITFDEFVLTTVMRCVPPVRASDVLSWLELALNFPTPSRYNCMRLIGCVSLPWAITCTGEVTTALLPGVQIVT